MSSSQVRNWLGLYVLCLTVFLGGYSLLAPDVLLPLESADRTASFEIILPLLVAQISLVYRFFIEPDAPHRISVRDIPGWVVKAPPLLVSLLLAAELILFAFAGIQRRQPPSPEMFKGLVTFCVALLNATTVLIITRYFGSATNNQGEQK
jgi:hypothetical protein